MRRIACPVLVLWSRQGELDEWYDLVAIWKGWTDDVRGAALDCGHYLAGEAWEEARDRLLAFFISGS